MKATVFVALLLAASIMSKGALQNPQIFNQINEAKTIMGAKDVYGPQEIEKALGIKIDSNLVPPIPFSVEELRKANSLGMYLILRIPLSLDSLNKLLQGRVGKEDRLFYKFDLKDRAFKKSAWYPEEDWFQNPDCPKMYWALNSNLFLAGTKNSNYLVQTEKISSFLKDKVFADKPLPEPYLSAIAEWDSLRPIIKEMMFEGKCENLCDSLVSALKINRLCRPSPAATIYDVVLNYKINKKRTFTQAYVLTNAHDSKGLRIFVGYFDALGFQIDKISTEEPDEETGCLIHLGF